MVWWEYETFYKNNFFEKACIFLLFSIFGGWERIFIYVIKLFLYILQIFLLGWNFIFCFFVVINYVSILICEVEGWAGGKEGGWGGDFILKKIILTIIFLLKPIFKKFHYICLFV